MNSPLEQLWGVTRTEDVDLSATLTFEDMQDPVVMKFKEAMEELGPWKIEKEANDSVAVNYKFSIDYLDNVQKRLRAWIDLMKSGVIVAADFDHIDAYKLKSLLIVELMDSLRDELKRQDERKKSNGGGGDTDGKRKRGREQS